MMADILEDLVSRLGKVELTDDESIDVPSPGVQTHQPRKQSVEKPRPIEPLSLSKNHDVADSTTFSNDDQQQETGNHDDVFTPNLKTVQPDLQSLAPATTKLSLSAVDDELKETKPLDLASLGYPSDDELGTDWRPCRRDHDYTGTSIYIRKRKFRYIRGRPRTSRIAPEAAQRPRAPSASPSRPARSPPPLPPFLPRKAKEPSPGATANPRALWEPTELENDIAYRSQNGMPSFGLASSSTMDDVSLIAAVEASTEDQGKISDSDLEDHQDAASDQLNSAQNTTLRSPPAGIADIQRTSMPCTFLGCVKTFSTQDTLNRHMRYHTRPEQCPHCPQRFGTKTHLERHINDIHEMVVRFHCSIGGCKYAEASGSGKSFARKEHLRRHAKNRHGAEVSRDESPGVLMPRE